jgi:Mrp family chromosome partitioning ATPase
MAADNLRAANIRILGAVLNKRTFPIPSLLYKKL